MVRNYPLYFLLVGIVRCAAILWSLTLGTFFSFPCKYLEQKISVFNDPSLQKWIFQKCGFFSEWNFFSIHRKSMIVAGIWIIFCSLARLQGLASSKVTQSSVQLLPVVFIVFPCQKFLPDVSHPNWLALAHVWSEAHPLPFGIADPVGHPVSRSYLPIRAT